LALTNLAMMGIGPEAAKEMDLWEYEGLLFHWNEAHGTSDKDDGGPLPLPDREKSLAIVDMINGDPRLTGAGH
jgi:hypothetical protein